MKDKYLGWLGFREKFDLSNARRLGAFFGFLIVLLAIATGALGLLLVFDLFRAVLRLEPYSQDITGEAARNIGLLLVGIFGAPFLIWRTVVAAKQVRIADETLFNEKITAAGADLAANKEISRKKRISGQKHFYRQITEDLVVRAAAIDRLEGLCSEKLDLAPRVSRLLAAYIRTNFPCKNLVATSLPFRTRTPRMDLQRAVDALGRVHKLAIEVDHSNWRLDLQGVNFDGVSFEGGFFRAANLRGSRFEASSLRDSNLEGAILNNSLLNFADFFGADMTGAKLHGVKITEQNFFGGSFSGASTKGISFVAADLSGVRFLGGKEKISQTFGTKDTILHPQLRSDEMNDQEFGRALSLYQYKKDGNLITADEAVLLARLLETGFQNWSAFDSDDLATGHHLAKLYQELGLKKWPYWPPN